jgi:antitoxin VapB
MGMNIKDPAVHAMAKQLAARRGTSVTDAVRQALQADLARTPDLGAGAARAARAVELQELLASCRRLPRLDSRSGRDLQESLYGDDGLPR